jgi:hypothetical protein
MDPRSMVGMFSQQRQCSLLCLSPQWSTSRLRQLNPMQPKQLQQQQPLKHPHKKTLKHWAGGLIGWHAAATYAAPSCVSIKVS